MKNGILVTLLLSLTLALPMFAQQSSSDSQAASSERQTATGKEPLQHRPENWWDGDQPGAAWLVLHPFASKQYVRRNVQVIQDRVNELEELTSSNGKMVKDVDTRAQQGIQLVSTKISEADQHAMDASSKAQGAQQTATNVTNRAATVETVVGNLDQFKASNRTVIRFRSGQSALSKQAKDALDQMAGSLKDQHGYVLEVQGFSTGSGQAGIAASRKMADSVVRYLVLNHEIPSYRIYVMPLGNAAVASDDGAGGKPTRGSRVEVSLLKNGLDQMAATSDAGNAPASTEQQPK